MSGEDLKSKSIEASHRVATVGKIIGTTVLEFAQTARTRIAEANPGSRQSRLARTQEALSSPLFRGIGIATVAGAAAITPVRERIKKSVTGLIGGNTVSPQSEQPIPYTDDRAEAPHGTRLVAPDSPVFERTDTSLEATSHGGGSPSRPATARQEAFPGV